MPRSPFRRPRVRWLLLLAFPPSFALMIYLIGGVTENALRFLAGLGVLSLLALAALSLRADLSLERRLQQILHTLQRRAAGEFSARAGPAPEADEAGQAASALDELAQALERREAQFRLAGAEHEAEWRAMNERLQRELEERQRMEAALSESEKRFRALIENSSDAIALISAEGTVLYASTSTERVTGYTHEELVGRVAFELIHPDDQEHTLRLLAELAQTPGQAVTTQYRVRHKDGSWRWMEGTGTNLLDEPSIQAIVVNYRDVTERRLAEEKLEIRARQQAAAAEIGQRALAGTDLAWLMNEAVTQVAQTLEVEYCKVLELLPDGKALLLRAGVGWKEGCVGKATVGTGLDSQAGYTLISNRPVIVEDLRVETRFSGPQLLHDHEIISGMSVLIPGRDHPFGVLGAHTARRRTFTEDDLHFLQAVANVLASGIERKRVEEELQQANEKLKVWVDELEEHAHEITQLSEMGELLQACRTVQEAYAVIAKSTQQLFPAESGALYVLNASRNIVEAMVTWGAAPPSAAQQVFVPDDCWALRRGQVHLARNPRADLVCQHLGAPLPGSSLCVPLVAQGEALGVLHLRSSPQRPGLGERGKDQLTRGKQRVAVTVAEQVALAVANLRLRDTLRSQAIRDPLTGLFNRRYMEESLAREIHRTARRSTSLGVIMLDLDHFKMFNDAYGHAAGDILLRELGAFLQSRVRMEDIACRYGGEEFTLIFPEASLADTRQRAEQLRADVKHLTVQHRGQPLGGLTLSLGVAIFPDHGANGEAVLQAADAALYRAKREGRDRVVVAQSLG